MSVLAREQIMGMIPHQGAMCLLDEVLEWDANSVRALSHRFCNADNPMRRPDGTLGAACLVELAAQAMALHARLVAPQTGSPERDRFKMTQSCVTLKRESPSDPLPTPGYLVALREVRLARATLDATMAPLGVIATRLMMSGQGASYSFRVSNQGAEIVSGRATVRFGVAS